MTTMNKLILAAALAALASSAQSQEYLIREGESLTEYFQRTEEYDQREREYKEQKEFQKRQLQIQEEMLEIERDRDFRERMYRIRRGW